MSRLQYHPAPGIGEILPGFYVVPQNPLRALSAEPVRQLGITRTPHIGELVAANYVVPQNPLRKALGMPQMGELVRANYVVPQNPLRGSGRLFWLRGLRRHGQPGGTFSDLMFTTSFPQFGNLPNWVLLGGGAFVAWWVYSHLGKGGRTRRNPHRRNIEQGFYDKQGRFHPIRASADYDASAVGESLGERRRVASKKKGWRH